MAAARPHTNVAAYCAFGLAGAYFAAGVTFAITPGRPTGPDGILYLAGTAPGWATALYLELAAGGLLGLGLVSAASRLASSPVPPWVEWAGRFAYLSFAIIVADGFRLAALVPQLGQLYHGCGSCTGTLAEQQTLARWLFTTLPLDPQNWIAFGILGVWVLALCAAGLQSGRLPRLLAYLGIALTLAFWLLVAGSVSAQPALFIVGAVAGGIVLGPLFFAWLGVQLRRSGESV